MNERMNCDELQAQAKRVNIISFVIWFLYYKYVWNMFKRNDFDLSKFQQKEMSIVGSNRYGPNNTTILVIIFRHCRGRKVDVREPRTLYVTNTNEKVRDAIEREAKEWRIANFSYDIITPRREPIGDERVLHFIGGEIHVVQRPKNSKRKDLSNSEEESCGNSSSIAPPPFVSIANQQDADAFNVQISNNYSIPDLPMKRKMIPPADKKEKKTRLAPDIDLKKIAALQMKAIGKLLDREVLLQCPSFDPRWGAKIVRLPSKFMQSVIEVLLQDEKVLLLPCDYC